MYLVIFIGQIHQLFNEYKKLFFAYKCDRMKYLSPTKISLIEH